MTNPRSDHDGADEAAENAKAPLRQRAERAFAARQKKEPADSTVAAAQLLHELQVHQIELEMQNEELRLAQEALAVSKTRYFDLYDLAPVGYVTLSEKGLILEANLAATMLLGTTRRAADKLRFTQFILAEDQDTYYLHRQRLLQTGEAQRCEVRIAQAAGTLRWVRLDMSVTHDEVDGAAIARVVLSDITQRKRAEERIADQLAEITFYYDNAPIGLTVLDADLRFVRVNKLLAEINGVAAADHPGRTVEEVVPDLAAQARELAASILATGEPVTEIELSGETAAHPGVKRYWRESWYPIKRDDQMIIGFSVIAEDISERRQVEEALKQSQQNLARAQQIGQMGSWEWDPHNQTLFWSDELYRIFGVDHDFPLTYAAIEAMIHPEDRARNNATLQNAFVAADSVDFEFRIIRPDDALRHIFQSIEVTRDATGAATSLFGIMQDITERKAAAEALRRSEANLHAMIENTDDLIALRDSAGYLVAFNSSFASMTRRLFGVEARAGLRTMDFLPEAQQRHWEAVLAKVQCGEHYQEELPGEAEDGVHHYELSIYPIRTGDAIIGSTEFTRDITARKQAEQEREHLQAQLAQAQKLETIGRLASGIAHDFNNMLAVIMMRTELALYIAPADTPMHRHLTAILTTTQHSAELVRNLLGFARKQTIAPTVLDLNATVARMLPMLHELIGEEVELRWQPVDLLWSVKLDPTQIDQLLANLCINARDAIGGVGAITLETANVTLAGAVGVDGAAIPPGDYVLLAISDTGSGMDQDLLPHIFEPFFTTKTFGKGSGLGLATVDGIAQQNRGAIQVHSELGVGTTFKIYFPRFVEAVVPAQGAAQAQEAPQGRGETVLLVEDEAVVLRMATDALQYLGYTVIAAAAPSEALRLVAAHAEQIDLLITDIIMPEMNGRDLAEHIAELRPGIKCLFVSGYPADYVAYRGALAPGVHFLQKPFSLTALAQKVQAALTA